MNVSTNKPTREKLVVVKAETRRAKILKLLSKEPGLNTAQITRVVGGQYRNVRRLLGEMQRAGLVEGRMVRRFYPGKKWILVNEWTITKKGLEWLRRWST